MIRFISNFLLVVVCLGAASCISRLEKHGYMFDLADHDLLQEGVTSKERVLKIMGSPTLISDLNQDEAWIYYFENVKHLLFFYPKIEERTILVLRFDNAGVVRELKSLNLEDQNSEVDFAKNYTAVDSHEVGFFKSIFSNVGQIKPQ